MPSIFRRSAFTRTVEPWKQQEDINSLVPFISILPFEEEDIDGKVSELTLALWWQLRLFVWLFQTILFSIWLCSSTTFFFKLHFSHYIFHLSSFPLLMCDFQLFFVFILIMSSLCSSFILYVFEFYTTFYLLYSPCGLPFLYTIWHLLPYSFF